MMFLNYKQITEKTLKIIIEFFGKISLNCTYHQHLRILNDIVKAKADLKAIRRA